MTKTDMVPDDVLLANMKNIPMKRGGEPIEIATFIAFLLSSDASYASGANIRIGGGRPVKYFERGRHRVHLFENTNPNPNQCPVDSQR